MAKSYATQSSNRYRKYNFKTFGSSVLCQIWIVNFSLNSLFPIFFFKQETYSKITKWYIYNALHATIHHTTFSQYAILSTANFSYIVPMYKTEKRTKKKNANPLKVLIRVISPIVSLTSLFHEPKNYQWNQSLE